MPDGASSQLTTHNKQTTRSCNILARWHGAWGHNNKGAATTMMQHWRWHGQGQSGGNNKNKLAHKTVEVKSRFSCLFYFFSPLSPSLFRSLSLIALLSTNFFGFFLFPFDDDAALLIVAGNYFFSVNCCDCSVKMGKGERKGRGGVSRSKSSCEKCFKLRHTPAARIRYHRKIKTNCENVMRVNKAPRQ